MRDSTSRTPKGSPTSEIEELSADQAEGLESYRQEWLAHGRSTRPSDRSTAERVWTEMYAALGRPKPVVLWFDGPATASLARAMMLGATGPVPTRRPDRRMRSTVRSMLRAAGLDAGLGNELGKDLRARLRDRLEPGLEANLARNLGGKLLALLRRGGPPGPRAIATSLSAHLEMHLETQLGTRLERDLGSCRPLTSGGGYPLYYVCPDWDQGVEFFTESLWPELSFDLWAGLWAHLGTDLRLGFEAGSRRTAWASLGTQVRDILYARLVKTSLRWMWGQHEAAWPAFYAWPHLGLRPMHSPEEWRRLAWWLDLSRSTGWWEPFEHAVVACERPMRQSVDGRGRLHHDSAPALLCRDGWRGYAVHGVRVPQYVVERPQEITVEKIDAERNTEVRRVMIERLGGERYVTESGFQRVHADECGELYVRCYPDGTLCAVVRVVDVVRNPDDSPKVHFLPVDIDLRPMRVDERTRRIAYGERQAWTARNAVASTFGLRGEQYAPGVQT